MAPERINEVRAEFERRASEMRRPLALNRIGGVRYLSDYTQAAWEAFLWGVEFGGELDRISADLARDGEAKAIQALQDIYRERGEDPRGLVIL